MLRQYHTRMTGQRELCAMLMDLIPRATVRDNATASV